jgi:hypothetical protein
VTPNPAIVVVIKVLPTDQTFIISSCRTTVVKNFLYLVPSTTVRFHRHRFIGKTRRRRTNIGCMKSIRSKIPHTSDLDKQDLSKNLKFFRVPESCINSIYSKLAMRVFDVYANTLKWMYSTRFSGGATRSEASSDAQPTPFVG